MDTELMASTVGDVASQPAWYVIHTRHQHEKTVAQILTSKGFETFLPLHASPHRWSDRTKMLSLPLFPCYVFLQGGLDRRLDLVTTPGIHSLVSFAGQPAAIPTDEMNALRRAVESGASIEPHPFLECGDWVRVKSGSLAGVQGILVRKKNLYRLVLSVELLGKAAAVEVDGFLVERIESNRSGACSVDRRVATALPQLRSATAV
jgi:transcription antitermination factor NusG